MNGSYWVSGEFSYLCRINNNLLEKIYPNFSKFKQTIEQILRWDSLLFFKFLIKLLNLFNNVDNTTICNNNSFSKNCNILLQKTKRSRFQNFRFEKSSYFFGEVTFVIISSLTRRIKNRKKGIGKMNGNLQKVQYKKIVSKPVIYHEKIF